MQEGICGDLGTDYNQLSFALILSAKFEQQCRGRVQGLTEIIIPNKTLPCLPHILIVTHHQITTTTTVLSTEL